MHTTFSNSLFSNLSDFIDVQTGLYFPPNRWSDLEQGVSSAATDLNLPDGESCARWLLSTPLTSHTKEILANHLGIGGAYFFREKRVLNVLREQVIPQLLQSRREGEKRLRIWSAGCNTGEEAYTIAIMLDRLIPDIDEWEITILATDFNRKFLHKATQGLYEGWSFRKAPHWLREEYFTSNDNKHFEIIPRIKKMVTFSHLNFFDDVFPSLKNNTSAMDIIFCRNVLKNFNAQRSKQVIDNFKSALTQGGWLIVSSVDVSNSLFSSLTPVYFRNAVLYQKKIDDRP